MARRFSRTLVGYRSEGNDSLPAWPLPLGRLAVAMVCDRRVVQVPTCRLAVQSTRYQGSESNRRQLFLWGCRLGQGSCRSVLLATAAASVRTFHRSALRNGSRRSELQSPGSRQRSSMRRLCPAGASSETTVRARDQHSPAASRRPTPTLKTAAKRRGQYGS